MCIVIVFLSSCHTVSKNKEGITYDKNSFKGKNYEVLVTPLIIETDTFHVNELRFYDIQSSNDCSKMMYENYGEWDRNYPGKYKSNNKQFEWSEIKLLNSEERFTIITDGTETQSNYFGSIIILDSTYQDCLDEKHINREYILNFLLDKMENISSDTKVYKLFK